MDRVDVVGLALEILETGSGPTVLLVHGSACDRETWEAQANVLASDFRVLRFSRRYHWPNPPPGDGTDYSMAEQLDDLAGVVDAVGSGPLHLIGHSYGAYLALVHALRYPAGVSSLVLAEPPVIPLFTSFPPKPVEILRLLLTRPRTALPVIRFVATGLAPASAAARKGNMDTALARFGTAVLGAEAFTAMSADRLQQAERNFSRAELLSDCLMLPLEPAEVAALEVPVLLLAGEKSPAVFHRLLARLFELLPNAERQIIPAASHNMHEGNPAVFNEVVGAFLRSRQTSENQAGGSGANDQAGY